MKNITNNFYLIFFFGFWFLIEIPGSQLYENFKHNNNFEENVSLIKFHRKFFIFSFANEFDLIFRKYSFDEEKSHFYFLKFYFDSRTLNAIFDDFFSWDLFNL